MVKKIVILVCFLGTIVLLDQLTKVYVHTEFDLGQSVPVVSGFFNITYVRNTGAAFGFMRSAQPLLRKVFFLSITPIAMILILGIMNSTPERDTIQLCALSSIFAGALGNYLDRLRYGFVVDFLDFHLGHQWHYPAFNVADMAIVCGVFTLIVLNFLRPQEKAA